MIRDLTLRSAASFGSFHLIRLLLDEYLFYALELRLAARTGSTLLEVMYELRPQANNGLADEDAFNSDRARPDAFHVGVRERYAPSRSFCSYSAAACASKHCTMHCRAFAAGHHEYFSLVVR